MNQPQVQQEIGQQKNQQKNQQEDLKNSVYEAALLLHAMQPQDCDWLLAQLDAQQRDALQVLLIELRELGIPQDQTLLSQLKTQNHSIFSSLADAPEKSERTAEPTQQNQIKSELKQNNQAATEQSKAEQISEQISKQLIHQLMQIPAIKIAAALRNEPAALIAICLSIADWPWRQAVLQQIGALKRRQTEDLLPALLTSSPAPAAEKLINTLLTLLMKRIQSAEFNYD